LFPFGISKPPGADRIWLTRGTPFVTWGPESKARRYPTERMARRVIDSLPDKDREGAEVASFGSGVLDRRSVAECLLPPATRT
jgi:hypothetical protein